MLVSRLGGETNEKDIWLVVVMGEESLLTVVLMEDNSKQNLLQVQERWALHALSNP